MVRVTAPPAFRDIHWQLPLTMPDGSPHWLIPLQIVNLHNAGEGSIGSNLLWAVGFPLPLGIKADRIGVQVTVASVTGTMARLGIYTSERCYPKTLIVDAGEVSLGAVGTRSLPIDVTLHKGLYWLAIVTNQLDTTLKVKLSVNNIPLVGGWDDLYEGFAMCNVSFVYAPLPSTYPTGGDYDYRVWDVGLRVSGVLE